MQGPMVRSRSRRFPAAFAEPHWLEELHAAARQNLAFDVFGSKLVNAVDPTVLDGAGNTYHMIGLVPRMGNSSPVLTS